MQDSAGIMTISIAAPVSWSDPEPKLKPAVPQTNFDINLFYDDY